VPGGSIVCSGREVAGGHYADERDRSCRVRNVFDNDGI